MSNSSSLSLESKEKIGLGLIVACLALTVAIFVIDIAMPLGVAGGVPYVAPLLLSLWLSNRRFIWFMAVLATVLTVLGYVLSPVGGTLWMVFVNRILAIFVIWITAILGQLRRHLEESLRKAHHELEDKVLQRTEQLTKTNDNLLTEIKERIKAEANTKQSEERLSLALDAVGGGVFDWDQASDTWTRSDSWYELTGFSSVELEEWEAQHGSIIHSDDVDGMADAFNAHLRGECDRYHYEFRIHHKSGDWRWLLGRGLIVDCAEDGTPLRMVGTDTDITDRKNAEEALRDSEKRHRAIVEDQTELICRWLPEEILTFVNDAYCQYFQKSKSELVGHSFMPLIPKEDQPAIKSHIESLSSSNPVASIEHRVITADGSIRWQHWTNRILVDSAGNITEYQSVGRDVTARKKANDALKMREQQFRLFSLSTGDCFWNWDMVAGTVERSSGFERAFGYPEQDILPCVEWWMERIHPDDRERVSNVFDAAVAGDQSTCGYEYRFRCRDDSYAVVDDHVCLIRDARGKVVRSLGAMQDITERKLAEEALIKAHDELEDRVKLRTTELTEVNDLLRSEIKERARAEEKLRLQGKIVENMAEGIALVRPSDGVIIYSNLPHDRMFGYEPGELLGQNVSVCNAPDQRDPQETSREISEHLERTGSWIGEVHNIRKDGTTFWSHAIVTTLEHPEHGTVWVGVLEDVTEKKEAEEALRESEERYRNLFHQAPISLWEEDYSALVPWFDELRETGVSDLGEYFQHYPEAVQEAARLIRVVDVNEGTLRLFGVGSMAELLTTPLNVEEEQRASKFSNQAFVEQLIAIWEGQRRFETEFTARTYDGAYLDCLLQLVAPQVPGKLDLSYVIIAISDITDRKRAEEALRKSEERFRSIYEQGQLGVVLVDSDYRFVNVNPKFCKLLGYTEEELTALRFTDITHPEDIDTDVELASQVFQGEIPSYQIEKRYLRKDGETITVNLTASVLRGVQGEPVYGLGMIEDITARKQAEEARRASESRFRGLLEAEPDGVVVVDSKGMIQLANAVTEEMFGYEHGELIGKPVEIFVPQRLHAAHILDRAAYLTSPHSRPMGTSLQVNGQRKDGSEFPADVSLSPLETDEGLFVMSIIRDITERKLAETALQDSEERFRVVFEAAPSGMVIANADGKPLRYNSAIQNMLGYSEEELRSMTVADFTHTDDVAEGKLLYDELKEGKRDHYQLEKRYIRKDGEILWGNLAFSSVRDDFDEIQYLIATVKDITERKRAENLAAEQMERLQKLSQLSMALSGDPMDVLKRIVRMIGELLDVSVVCLSEIRGDELYFLCVYAHGEVFIDTGHCPLSITPCSAVTESNDICFFNNVAESFPHASFLKEYHAQSYIGLPCLDSDGEVIAVTCLLDDKPREYTEVDKDVLRIFAQRIGAEMERQKQQVERKQAEADRLRLAGAVESAGEAIVITDTEGIIQYVNPAFEQINGYSPGDVVGKNPRILKSGKHSAAFYRKLWDTLLRGEQWRGQFINRKKDGTLYDVDATIAPVKDSQGLIVNYVAVTRDITDRKRVEAALQDSEERFRVVFEAAPSGMVIADADGNALRYNSAMQNMLGYSEDEMRSMDISQYTHEDDLAEGKQYFNELREGKRDHYQLEKRYIRKDGQILWGNLAFSSVRNDLGEVQYLIASVKDITERKRAEGALHESEERMRLLLEGTFEGIAIHEEGQIIKANQAFADMFGYEIEELTGISHLDLTSPESGKKIARHIAMGYEKAYEAVGLKKDGSLFDIELIGKNCKYRGRNARITAIRDISDRKRAEEALHESEETIRALVETSQDWIWSIELNGMHTYCNPAVEQILGYTPDEMRSMQTFDLIHEDDREIIQSRLSDAIASKEGWEGLSIRWKHRDGHYRTLESSAVPLIDGKGEFVGFRGTDRDITDRKRAEEQARQLQADLAHLSRVSSLGEMASGLAHELNQPLTVITNYANGCIRRLHSESLKQDELKEILERISAQARRGGSIIRGLESLVRKAGVKRTPIDINDSILEVLDLAEVDAKRHKATTHIELQSNLPSVMADPTQVQQVILNLVQNACEACEQVPVSQRVVTVQTAMASEDELEIIVSDSGPGVASELSDHLFEPFFTTKVKGIGMGLAISRSIVEAHHGKLWSTENPEAGACFHFTLPIAKEDKSHEK